MDYSNYESEDQYNKRIEHYKQSIKNCTHDQLSISGFLASTLICSKCCKMFKLPTLIYN